MYKKLPYFPSDDDVKRMFEALRQRWIKRKSWKYNVWAKSRDKLILYFGFYIGMRLREISGVNLKDIDLRHKTILVNIHFAKFGKERILPLPPIVWWHLWAYIKNYRHLFPDGYIFTTSKGKKLTTRGMSNIVTKIIKAAGLWEYYMVEPQAVRAKLHFHSMRHYCATRIYNKTRDPFAVSIWLGHKNPESSWVYVHESIERKREIMNAVFRK